MILSQLDALSAVSALLVINTFHIRFHEYVRMPDFRVVRTRQVRHKKQEENSKTKIILIRALKSALSSAFS